MVEFCCVYLGFTPIHLRTSSCQYAAALPKHCREELLPLITDLVNKAATSGGEVLRKAVWDALFLFPTLVLDPHKPGAALTTVETEIVVRLDLWNKRKKRKKEVPYKRAYEEHRVRKGYTIL